MQRARKKTAGKAPLKPTGTYRRLHPGTQHRSAGHRTSGRDACL